MNRVRKLWIINEKSSMVHGPNAFDNRKGALHEP